MNKIIVIVLIGLTFSAAEAADAGHKIFTTLGHNPGCYELPNSGAVDAISKAVEQAHIKCASPVLQDLKVNIKQIGGCNPTTVKATFVCLEE